MLDAKLVPPIDYQLLRWHDEGLSLHYMASRLSLSDVQRRLEAALEGRRRAERFAEAQAAKSRPKQRSRPDRFSELRARVLAGWTDAQGYFKEREQRA